MAAIAGAAEGSITDSIGRIADKVMDLTVTAIVSNLVFSTLQAMNETVDKINVLKTLTAGVKEGKNGLTAELNAKICRCVVKSKIRFGLEADNPKLCQIAFDLLSTRSKALGAESDSILAALKETIGKVAKEMGWANQELFAKINQLNFRALAIHLKTTTFYNKVASEMSCLTNEDWQQIKAVFDKDKYPYPAGFQELAQRDIKKAS